MLPASLWRGPALKKSAIALAIVLATASCGGGSETEGVDSAPTTEVSAVTTTPQAMTAAVSIEAFAFTSDDLTIPAGTTVTWTNDEDAIAHTTTSDDGLWDSNTLDPGEQFSFTFEEPGTYSHFCSIHPPMKATITVEG